MKFYVLLFVLVVGCAGLASYLYDHLAVRRNSRRNRKKLLAHLATLPPVKADFSTPEGAILCFENCLGKSDVDAAAACRDFVAEARLWLQEKGHLSQEMKEKLLPETVQSMEKSFRINLATKPSVDWTRARSYFLKREPFSSGMTVVSKTTQLPGGNLLSQRVVVVKSDAGWRVVKHLPDSGEGSD
jgi:hypothetical protein